MMDCVDRIPVGSGSSGSVVTKAPGPLAEGPWSLKTRQCSEGAVTDGARCGVEQSLPKEALANAGSPIEKCAGSRRSPSAVHRRRPH